MAPHPILRGGAVQTANLPTFGGSLPARLAESGNDGGTIFISPTGNDTTGDGSQSSPYFTLHKAFSVVALTGGLIYARGGTYNYAGTGVSNTGQQQFNRVGNVNNPPQVRAYPGETPVFNNVMVLIGQSGGTGTARGLRWGPGLTIGSGVNSEGFDGLRVENCVGHVEVVGSTFSNVPRGNGILVQYTAAVNPTQVQIWDSIFHHNGKTAANGGPTYHGVYFGKSDATSVLANCVFYDNVRFACQLGPDGSNGIITCCTHHGIVGDVGGFTIWSQAPANTYPNGRIFGTIVSSVTANYGYAFSGLLNTDAPQIHDSIGYNCSPGAIEPQTGLVTSNISTANPLFVDVANRDLRISAGSPAADLIAPAHYAWVPPNDILGNPRLTADAGAYAKES